MAEEIPDFGGEFELKLRINTGLLRRQVAGLILASKANANSRPAGKIGEQVKRETGEILEGLISFFEEMREQIADKYPVCDAELFNLDDDDPEPRFKGDPALVAAAMLVQTAVQSESIEFDDESVALILEDVPEFLTSVAEDIGYHEAQGAYEFMASRLDGGLPDWPETRRAVLDPFFTNENVCTWGDTERCRRLRVAALKYPRLSVDIGADGKIQLRPRKVT